MSKPIFVSSAFQYNLNDHNQGLLTWSASRSCYEGDVVNTAMEEWYKANCA